MKRQQQFITTLSLTVALSGLSPVMAADAERTSGDVRLQVHQRQSGKPQRVSLSAEQMDNVRGGRWNECSITVCLPRPATDPITGAVDSGEFMDYTITITDHGAVPCN
jgi:hypothetical protein